MSEPTDASSDASHIHFTDKLRSIQFAGKKASAKVVTDVHDHHTVTVTTHDERQDVTVKAPAIRLSQGETSG